jgi:hypothetical protein
MTSSRVVSFNKVEYEHVICSFVREQRKKYLCFNLGAGMHGMVMSYYFVVCRVEAVC